MKLPIGNFFEKKTDSEYFLTLTLRNERATAVVFEKTSGRVKVVGKGEKEFKRKIKKEYLGKLKKISDSLDLKPMGFLVVTEAISHLLQKEEGAPVSAILCE